jgi:hypothetical protein
VVVVRSEILRKERPRTFADSTTISLMAKQKNIRLIIAAGTLLSGFDDSLSTAQSTSRPTRDFVSSAREAQTGSATPLMLLTPSFSYMQNLLFCQRSPKGFPLLLIARTTQSFSYVTTVGMTDCSLLVVPTSKRRQAE